MLILPNNISAQAELLFKVQSFLDTHHVTDICEAFREEAKQALRNCARSEFAMSLIANFAAGAVAGTAGKLFSRGVLSTGLRILGSSQTALELEKIALRQLVKLGSVNLLALRFTAGVSNYLINASVFNSFMGHAGAIQNIRTAADFALMHPGSLLSHHLLKQVSPLPLRLFADFLFGGINFCFSSGARVALENIIHDTHDTFAAHFSVAQVLEGGAMHLGNRAAEWGTNNISNGLKSVFNRVQNLFTGISEVPLPLQTVDGTVVFMTSKGELPTTASARRTRQIATHEELLQIVDGYEAAYLFVGHGSKSQYENVSEVLPQVEQMVGRLNTIHGKGKWLAIFGGDNFNAEKPDIAHIMKHLKEQSGVPVLAIQSDVVVKQWSTPVDAYVDYAHYVETDYYTECGAQKIYWGGFDGTRLLGPTRIYLGESFTNASSVRPRLRGVIAVGGGPIGLQEVQYASSKNIPITYIRARARYPEVNGEFGSIEDTSVPVQTLPLVPNLGNILGTSNSTKLTTSLVLIDLLKHGPTRSAENRVTLETGFEVGYGTLNLLFKSLCEKGIVVEIEGSTRKRIKKGGDIISAGGKNRIYYRLTEEGVRIATALRDSILNYLR